MNNLDKQYTDLLQDILDNGIEKEDRTNIGTLSVFGRQITHNMKDGFPMLTTKKLPFKTILTELLWFLKGDTNIKYLVDNDCNIWNGDAYLSYSKESEVKLTQEEFVDKIKTDDIFAKQWGYLGPIYGKQWRNWDGIDQINKLIEDLKTNPDSRRLMVNAWNVGDLDKMVLPPCHYGFQIYTRKLTDKEIEKMYIDKFGADRDDLYKLYPITKKRAISLIWNQRSADIFLGLPFNIASYALLLSLIAKEVDMVPEKLIGNLGDVHLYKNHIDQAKEQIGEEITLDEKLTHRLPRTLSCYLYVFLRKFMKEKYISDRLKEQVHYDFERWNNIPLWTREPFYDLPSLHIYNNVTFKNLDPEYIELNHYRSHPSIKAPLNN